MKLDINTPEFWEQVKADFKRDSSSHFLCKSSSTFDDAFNASLNAGFIKDCAREFHENSKYKDVLWIGVRTLFMHDLSEGDYYKFYREIRLEFLDYMINRTRNEQSTL